MFSLIKKESIHETVAAQFEKHKDAVLGFALSDNDMANFLDISDGTLALSPNASDATIFHDAKDIANWVHALNTTHSSICLLGYKEEDGGGHYLQSILYMDIDSFIHQKTFSMPLRN